MDVPVIEMDKQKAHEKWAEYSRALRRGYPTTEEGKRQRELDLANAAGFAALADGLRVINVHTALSYAGLYQDGIHKGLPRLAIARADASKVVYRFDHRGADFTGLWGQREWSFKRKHASFMFPNLIWNEKDARAPFTNNRWQYKAIVPSIPPNVRPKFCHLASHAILWEASWERAPVDPYLLRPLRGDLFVVVAEWDLTDLERSILEHAVLR